MDPNMDTYKKPVNILLLLTVKWRKTNWFNGKKSCLKLSFYKKKKKYTIKAFKIFIVKTNV